MKCEDIHGYIVMERFRENLRHFITRTRAQGFHPIQHLISMARGLMHGLAFLHKNNIVHGRLCVRHLCLSVIKSCCCRNLDPSDMQWNYDCRKVSSLLLSDVHCTYLYMCSKIILRTYTQTVSRILLHDYRCQSNNWAEYWNSSLGLSIQWMCIS